MNIQDIKSITNIKIPFVKEAKKWIQNNPKTSALTLLAGITIAGLTIYLNSAQQPQEQQPQDNLVEPKLDPFDLSAEVLRKPSSLELAVSKSASEVSVAKFLTSSLTPQQKITHALNAKPYETYEQQKTTVPKSQLPLFIQCTSLCPCYKLNAESRVKLEKSALNLLEQRIDKTSLLTIVSVGPGNCFQEIVYLAKLAMAGYKHIQLVLIDPIDTSTEEIGLADFIKNYIPECHVRIVKYDSLTDYLKQVKTNRSLKPALLLMLDLANYKVGNSLLADHAYDLFHKEKILNANTVICYSTEEQIGNRYFPKAFSCTYDEKSSNLSQIHSNKTEIAVHPNGCVRTTSGGMLPVPSFY